MKTLQEWTFQELEDRLLLQKKSVVMLPEFELMIDDSLGFTIYIYGWLHPEDHEMYTTNLRSVCNITLSELLRNINSLYICPGVDPFELSSNIVHRLLSIDPLFIDSDGDVNSFPHKEYWRTCSCTVLFEHCE